MASIGIDIGATNATAAFAGERGVRVVLCDDGAEYLANVVARTSKGEELVGRAALRQAVSNAKHTVRGAARFLGVPLHRFDGDPRRDPAPTTRHGELAFRLFDQDLTPTELTAKVLAKLKSAAEGSLREPVTAAFIAVPLTFDAARWAAMQAAAQLAGLDAQYISQPVATAVAYGLHERPRGPIAVYDLGGRSADVALLEPKDGRLTVVSTITDTQIGGEHFDALVIEWMLREAGRLGDPHKGESIDLRGDAMAMQRLTEAAERARIELGSVERTSFNLPYIAAGPSGPVHFEATLTRTDLDEMVAPLIRQSVLQLSNVLGARRSTITDLLIAGGASQTPRVVQELATLGIGGTIRHDTPSTIVARGAAIAAAYRG